MKIKIEKKEDIKKGDILIVSHCSDVKRKVIEIYGDVVFLSSPNDYEIVVNPYHFAEIVKAGYFKEIPDYISKDEALKALHNGKKVKEIFTDKVYYYDADGIQRYNLGNLSYGLSRDYQYEIID